jgi:hypothetical protein
MEALFFFFSNRFQQRTRFEIHGREPIVVREQPLNRMAKQDDEPWLVKPVFYLFQGGFPN